MQLVPPIAVDDSVLVGSNVLELDYAAWNGGVTYAAGDKVLRLGTNIHRVYQSAAAGNTNHDPLTDNGTWWTLLGADNRWAMFDGKVGSQTTNQTQILVQLSTPSAVDTVALLNVSAASVRVTVTDTREGVVYDQTQNLVFDSGVDDWWAFFFTPVQRQPYAVFQDLPPYAGALITIYITDSGANIVGCGECLIGQSVDLGGTQWAPEVGIQDFSIKQQDAFGDFTIVERAYSNYGNFVVNVDGDQVDAVQSLLASRRATATLFVGDAGYGSTLIYGFAKDFHTVIAYPDLSLLSIELEGLT